MLRKLKAPFIMLLEFKGMKCTYSESPLGWITGKTMGSDGFGQAFSIKWADSSH